MTVDLCRENVLPEITRTLVASHGSAPRTSHLGHKPLPSRDVVAQILFAFLDVLYPGYGRRQNLHQGNVVYHVGDLLDKLFDRLSEQIDRALRHEQECDDPNDRRSHAIDDRAPRKALEMLRRLPALRHVLEEDVRAAYEGDPAARDYHEIICCYPGLEAITIYRLAHELLLLGVPLLPRMMTEWAHSRTGIDVHPGAVIGPGFFIDHGTGVVIGATCVLGRNVKLYQGVTLGALSFPRDAAGNVLRGMKRHPTLEDDVVVYANATILGGTTVIGKRSVIGSNVWLTHSVDQDTVVTLEKPRLRIRGPHEDPAQYYVI